MVIEWNKVTWYSKLLAVILFVGVFVIAFYFGEQYASIKQMEPTSSVGQVKENPEIIVSKTDEVTIGVGQIGRVLGLDIFFGSVVQDSRCPTDVQCIWAGAVQVNVLLSTGLYHTNTFDVSSDKPPQEFEGYKVSIVDVLPPPHSKKDIKLTDYRVTFHVDKKS